MKLVLTWYLAAIMNLKMAVLNVYNPAYLRIYLGQKHENWLTYFVVFTFMWNLVPITIDMVSDRHLELKKWWHWKSLNCHNSKYIDEERTQIGTNKLYDI